jgi:hypothetical protein
LSEYTSNHLPESGLREDLSLFLSNPMVRFDRTLFGESQSSNRPVGAPAYQPWQYVDREAVVQFG